MTKGYHALLCNYLFDTGKTWGEVVKRETIVAVVASFMGVLIGMGVPEVDEPTAYYSEMLVDEFDRDEVRAAPAKLVVEIQFMTKEYYALRKKTHAWFKVARAENAMGMLFDYRGGLA